jgi:hypothetical protein
MWSSGSATVHSSPEATEASIEDNDDESSGYVLSNQELFAVQRLQQHHQQQGEQIVKIEQQEQLLKQRITILEAAVQRTEAERADEQARSVSINSAGELWLAVFGCSTSQFVV